MSEHHALNICSDISNIVLRVPIAIPTISNIILAHQNVPNIVPKVSDVLRDAPNTTFNEQIPITNTSSPIINQQIPIHNISNDNGTSYSVGIDSPKTTSISECIEVFRKGG